MDTTTTNDICRKMDNVRCSLGDDVEDIVESARTLTDWRHYVKSYPWICLAGAAAVGYLVVPKRVEIVSPSASTLQKLAKRNKLVVSANPTPRAKGGIGGAVLSLVASSLARGAIGYIGQHAGKTLNAASEKESEREKPNR